MNVVGQDERIECNLIRLLKAQAVEDGVLNSLSFWDDRELSMHGLHGTKGADLDLG